MTKSIGSFLLAAFLAVPLAGHAQKPVQEGVVSTLYMEPPDTLGGLYAASQSVVVIRVAGERGVEGATPHQIVTEVTGTIVEVVKTNSQVGPAGSIVMFRVSGGEINRGDHIERLVAPGQPRLVPGQDYLVALSWNDNEKSFFLSYGPGSIFEVSAGVVTPQRNTALAAKVKGLGLRQFISQMKRDPS